MRRALRQQTLTDVVLSLVLTALVWPFPLARANMSVIAQVVAILVAWQIVQSAYFAVAAGIWGQTGGMRLAGLSLMDADAREATRSQRVRWGAIAGALALGRLFSSGGTDQGVPERLASVRLHLAD